METEIHVEGAKHTYKRGILVELLAMSSSPL